MRVHLPTALRRALLACLRHRAFTTLCTGALLAALGAGAGAGAAELEWTGAQSGYWDGIAPNWTPADGAGGSTTFREGDTAIFDGTQGIRDINVSSAHDLTDMRVLVGGYAFSGGGNIRVAGTLYVAIPDQGDDEAALTLSFGQANNITADTVLLQSGFGSETSFGATVTAGTLTMGNCATHGDQAGSYVFGNDVTVEGAFSAELSAKGHVGVDALTMLTVEGHVHAGSMSLGGSGNKLFNGAVEVAGDVVIRGFHEQEGAADSGVNGIVTFNSDVNIGGTLRITDHAEAIFVGHLHPTQGQPDDSLRIVLDDGLLRCEAPVSTTGEVICNIGTITLEGAGELSVGALSRVRADLVGNGQDFMVSGTSHEVDILLTGSTGNFSVSGGNVYLAGGGGSVGGRLSVADSSSLTLVTDNVLGSGSQGIGVDGSALHLGMTRQAVSGSISLHNGRIDSESASATAEDGLAPIADEGAAPAPGALVLGGATNIAYSGDSNELQALVEAGTQRLDIVAQEVVQLADGAAATDNALLLTGDISGSGSMVLGGAGTVTIGSDLSYTGSVRVEEGTTLVLGSESALAAASGLTVGSGATLSVTHAGTTTLLDGHGVYTNGSDSVDCALLLEDGASLDFTDLSGNGDTPALALGSGKLLFGGDINITFHETQEGKKLENLHTYELVTSMAGIDQAPGTTAGSVTVYANGKTTPLGSSQYEFAYYNDDNAVRHFTFTLLAGKSWQGGESGTWHDDAEWAAGVDGSRDVIFRQQAEGVGAVSISLTQQSGATGMYMDGATNYSISGTLAAGTQAFTEEGVYLVKKGSGRMEWNNVTATLGDVEVAQGGLRLSGGSSFSSTGSITVADIAYDSVGAKHTDATLAIDSSSAIVSGTSRISAFAAGTDAELHGVRIEGSSISGYSAGLSGSTTHTVSNAAISGYRLSALELAGTGSLAEATLGAGVAIASGANYTLGAHVTLEDTVENNGTLTFTSDSVIEIGSLSAGIGVSQLFTLYTGGAAEGWGSLGLTNFTINNISLDSIQNGNKQKVSITLGNDGQLSIECTELAFVNWDSRWNIAAGETPIISIEPGDKQLTPISDRNSAWHKDYSYDNRVDGGSSFIYVAHIAEGFKPKGGAALRGHEQASTSADAPAHVWISMEASEVEVAVAGTIGSEYWGDSHIQVLGDQSLATQIIGASRNHVQHGNSYMTFTAGNYVERSTIIAAGSYSTTASAAAATAAMHDGDSLLHITGGSFGTVYAGSLNTYTQGDTTACLSGGTVDTLYGGDYTTTATTHTGNVLIELTGGTVKNVYAAGGGSNLNKVEGNVEVRLYNEGGSLRTTFTSGGEMLGGADLAATEANDALVSGTSTLRFMDAEAYDLRPLSVDRFSVYQLATGASVYVQADGFNVSSDLTVSGAGEVIVLGTNATPHNVTLADGATLKLRSSFYQDAAGGLSTITATAGTTIDVSGVPDFAETVVGLNVHLFLAGHGTQGQGALYKEAGLAPDSGASFPRITLTDNALLGVDGSASFSMVAMGHGSTKLDLTGGTEGRGYVLSKVGEGDFGLFNTDIRGGIIHVEAGTLQSSYSSSGGDTDLVLHKGATFELMNDARGTLPGSFDGDDGTVAADFNGIAIESLTGEGEVKLGNNGWLYINMDKGYSDLGDHFEHGHEGHDVYEYAHFSGIITDEAQSRVTKTGSGTQYFTGSKSTYRGRTTVEGGILYLLGTSTASSFARGEVTVEEGVVGTASLEWSGDGAVWLGDGVRLYNNGEGGDGVMMTLGVGADVDEAGSVTQYHTARFSGVLRDADENSHASFEKVGKGTLEFDQTNEFSGGGYIREGTLKLLGWAALDAGTIAPEAGATLMIAHDGSYADEMTEATTNFRLFGPGDQRWAAEHEALEPGHAHTAALVSDIGLNKVLTLKGNILEGDAQGGLLHSGHGRLILEGTNSYRGGTVVTDGTLVAASDSALGDTSAAGGSELRLHADARLELAAGRKLTLAATSDLDASGVPVAQTDNDVRGTVALGEGASLAMESAGYLAARSELEAGSQLVFSGAAASNWAEDGSSPGGAGTLAGCGTLALSDVSGEGLEVYFQVTDSLHAGEKGFAGDMVVEGDRARLTIHGGELGGGNIAVSGKGAALDAARSEIDVEAGRAITLRSLGNAGEGGLAEVASLAAHSVDIMAGGRLGVSRAATEYLYSEQAQPTAEALLFSLEEAVAPAVVGAAEVTHVYAEGLEGDAAAYEGAYDEAAALNINAAAVVATDSLVLHGGAAYELQDSHTSLLGGDLTLSVESGSKVRLDAMVTYHNTGTVDQGGLLGTGQLVLFTDVANFTAILDGEAQLSSLTGGPAPVAGETAGSGTVYVARAQDYFEPSRIVTGQTLLVYDSAAQAVFLDGIGTVPEPTTATLTLLALAALCARRRRQGQG